MDADHGIFIQHSPSTWETNLWDDKNKRISGTAREVIGLISFGYKIIRPQRKLEAVAICDDRNKAMTASLLAYNKKIQMYSTYDTLQQFFKFIPRESIE